MLARWPERAGVVWLVVALFLMVLGLAKGIQPLLLLSAILIGAFIVNLILASMPLVRLKAQATEDSDLVAGEPGLVVFQVWSNNPSTSDIQFHLQGSPQDNPATCASRPTQNDAAGWNCHLWWLPLHILSAWCAQPLTSAPDSAPWSCRPRQLCNLQGCSATWNGVRPGKNSKPAPTGFGPPAWANSTASDPGAPAIPNASFTGELLPA